MKNYILIDGICSVGDGERTTTTSNTTVYINGIPRISVIGILASLLRSMKVDPIEILLYEAKHDSSQNICHAVEVPEDVLRAISEMRGEDEA